MGWGPAHEHPGLPDPFSLCFLLQIYRPGGLGTRQPDPAAVRRSRNQPLFAPMGCKEAEAAVLPKGSGFYPSKGNRNVATLIRGHRREGSCVPCCQLGCPGPRVYV